jgi:hypothetical protein
LDIPYCGNGKQGIFYVYMGLKALLEEKKKTLRRKLAKERRVAGWLEIAERGFTWLKIEQRKQ